MPVPIDVNLRLKVHTPGGDVDLAASDDGELLADPAVLAALAALLSALTDPSQLVPGVFDHIEVDPPDKPTTVIYRTGGPTGTITGTVVVTYVGDDVASLSRA